MRRPLSRGKPMGDKRYIGIFRLGALPLAPRAAVSHAADSAFARLYLIAAPCASWLLIFLSGKMSLAISFEKAVFCRGARDYLGAFTIIR